jgi:putative phage-type endonuclease
MRRTMIGASDIAAIAGLSPWKDAVDVLNDKLGFAEEKPSDEIDAAELGHRFEPVIRALYIEDQQCTIIPCGTVRHTSVEWAGCTLDSKVVGTKRGLECKLVGARMIYDWDPSEPDGVPHYYRAAAAWQMWVCELDELDVAAILGGTQFRIFRLERDRELEKHLVDLGGQFWTRHVLEQRMPEVTGSNSVRAYLDQKFPPLPDPVIVDADATMADLFVAREDAKTRRDQGEKDYQKTTQAMIAWLGERNATDAVGPDFEFRYRTRKDGTRQPWAKRKGER